jgi:hypothetical protein
MNVCWIKHKWSSETWTINVGNQQLTIKQCQRCNAATRTDQPSFLRFCLYFIPFLSLFILTEIILLKLFSL